METKKRNRREAYTLRVIRETFLELLQKQNVERISVGKLCQLADINRSTFYRHYTDVYALLNEICDEHFQALFSNLADLRHSDMIDQRHFTYSLILQACTITERNKELYQLLLFKQPTARFQQRLNDAFYQLHVGNHDITHTRNSETNLHYQYMISGIIGVWLAWLKDDCQIPKERVAALAEKHMGSAMHIIWTEYQEIPISRRVNFSK